MCVRGCSVCGIVLIEMAEQQLPELPLDVVRRIIKTARLDIDTRRALRVKPGRLVDDPSLDFVRRALGEMHARRKEHWDRQQSGYAIPLDVVRSPDKVIRPRVTTQVEICIWGPFDEDEDDDVTMAIEVTKTVEDDPMDPLAHLLPPGGGELSLLRAKYCRVHDGGKCIPTSIFDTSDVLRACKRWQ